LPFPKSNPYYFDLCLRTKVNSNCSQSKHRTEAEFTNFEILFKCLSFETIEALTCSRMVRGLNCPVKRGNVNWVLHRYCCDVAILLSLNCKRSISILFLAGQRPFGWLFLSMVGCSQGKHCHLGLISFATYRLLSMGFSMRLMSMSIQDNFEWGLIGIYGPNDNGLPAYLWIS